MLSQKQLAHPLAGALHPLRIVDYRRLLTSNSLWWLTLFMENVALGWLVLELTNSPWMVAVMGFFRSIPLLVFGLVGGAIIDRFGRRPVILSAQALNFSIYATLAVLLTLGRVHLWQLAIASFLLGTAWAMDRPARRALVPDLVGKERTVDALLLESFAQGGAQMIGPGFAGFLLAVLGPQGCIGLMAVFSATVFLVLRGLRDRPIPRTNMRPAASPWTVLGESMRYAAHHQPIFGVLIITVAFNLLLIPYVTLLPVFARDVLGVGPVGLGLLGSATGVGSFIGLLLINRLRRTISNGWILLAGTFAACITLFIFSQSQVYALSLGLLVVSGIGTSCFGIMQSSIILLSASDEMRQRTLGLVVLAIGADPFGKLQIGAMAQAFGAPFAVGVSTVMAAISIALVGIALPGLRRQAERPATRHGAAALPAAGG